MKKIIFLLTCLSVVSAQIDFSGDARIRPRLDIKDYGSNKSSMDLYYLYRARLNIDADIGGDWFFKAKIGTNDLAGMTTMGESKYEFVYYKDEDKDIPSTYYLDGYEIGDRPKISFLNLYYGFKKENFGFWGGALPISYTPALDIHFYPDKVVDIPWLVYSNSSAIGFSGYIYQMNWFISIDENKKETNKDISENINQKNMDSFTAGFDFPLKWNSMLNLHLRALFSFNNASKPWPMPMTFGTDFNINSFFGVTPQLSYYITMEHDQYSITHIRAKLDRSFGSGKLTIWTDLSSRIDQSNENYKTDYTFLWVDYKYQLFKSDFGSLSIKPTIRLLNKKNNDIDYTRMKFELTTEIKFK